MEGLYVVKRNKQHEAFNPSKIKSRISFLAKDLNNIINVEQISQLVCNGFVNGITTTKLDLITADTCQSMSYEHPDYAILASRIALSDLYKNTPSKFSDFIEMAYTIFKIPLICSDIYEWIMENKVRIDQSIINERDADLTYFAFKTIAKTYLFRNKNDEVFERPQYNLMRTAIGIHFMNSADGKPDIEDALQTYKYMSKGYFTMATPTRINACTPNGQLSSCFLLKMKEDSLEGIFETLTDCVKISKKAGGLGLAIHNIRSKGSIIHSTNGLSDGVIPMLKTYEAAIKYINQGGKRKGSLAIYIEPWHADIQDFLNLKREQGTDEMRTRDLFIALWVPDLFMKRVEADENWTLFCPNSVPPLYEYYGNEFEELYTKCEADPNIPKKIVRAHDIWKQICSSQVESGTPYILFKDSVNYKNNQSNLGVIKSSNLCVAPETRILTREGYKVISTLKDQEVEVWNGEEWSKTTVRQTSKSAKLIKVKVEGDIELQCTPEHKFIIITMEDDRFIENEIAAKNLRTGDVVTTYDNDSNILNNDWMKLIGLSKITEIINEGRFDATYCFNEPLRNRGIFNRILTCQCVEIMEHTSKDEVAVCNLASICLPKFVIDSKFDYEELGRIVKIVIKNLNKVIDINNYPIPEARNSNLKNRPVGLGVQGLADVFFKLKLPYDSLEARILNRNIFECIYYYSLEESNQLAKKYGCYESYLGSPTSNGKLQFDLWLEHDMKIFTPILNERVQSGTLHSGYWDWTKLKEEIKNYGLRNSLLIALMPTASTASAMGNTESFEPITSNIYTRSVSSGQFIVINNYLINDLITNGLWNKKNYNTIIRDNGSVQNLNISPELKQIYRTVWEIPQKSIIEMAADRAIYIDQSQSMNLYLSNPEYSKLTSMLFYAWRFGLKTGMYYLRSKPAVDAVKITTENDVADFTCPLDPYERSLCESCQ